MRVVLSVVVVLMVSTSWGGGRTMTIDDVVGLRRPSDLQISPDGNRIVFVVQELDSGEDRFTSDLYVAEIESGNTTRLTFNTGADWHPRWHPGGNGLTFLSDRDGQAAVYMMGDNGAEPRRLFSHAAPITQFEWHADGRAIVFIAADPKILPDAERSPTKPVIVVDQQPMSSRVWIFDVETGQSRALTESGVYVVEARLSPDGKVLAYLAEPSPRFLDRFQRELFIVSLSGGEPRQLTANQHIEHDLRWSPDGSQLSYLAASDKNPLGVGPPRIHVVTLSGGSPRVLARDFDGYVLQHEWTEEGSFIATVGLGVHQHLFRIPAIDGSPKVLTEGDGTYTSFAVGPSGKKLLLLRETTDRPADIWVWSDFNQQRRLTRLNPDIETLTLGKVETIRWKSSDGLEIEGLVVYPTDYEEGRRYPTILQIHGGPEGAHVRGFIANWNNFPHVYAGTGYVTFLPNFRSSSNYGAYFAHGAGANSAAAEDGVYQDLMTGLDYLVEKGVADPERLGVKGWSYGGYMTSWIIGHTNRFKAAAFGAGDTNLVSYYGTAVINPGFDILNEAPYSNFAKWIERSPLMSIANVKTPCLIFQGEKDLIVPIGQSQEFYKGLKHFGIATGLVIYPDEPHGLTVPSYMRDKMERELKWFETYLK